jgi:aminoglycoside/choline kinase family phosphotransferase
MKEALGKILKEGMGVASPIAKIIQLYGDASYRTYSRMHLADGRTFVVMQMPEGYASVSEEITNFKGPLEEPTFVSVWRYLKGLGIQVPVLHHYSEKDRLIILEDLGDDLMVRILEGATRDERIRLYRRAIDILVQIQKGSQGNGPSDCVAFKRSFDSELLNWEFDHFAEYGISERLERHMNSHDQAVFEQQTRTISAKIEEMNFGFTHRDFQSRNIIIRDGQLYLLDFQDALLGPAAYDLVALLRDSYFELPQTEVNELIRYYAGLMGRDHESLSHDFDLITVQRKLKDAGRFVYIDRVKKNPGFLQYIPSSLGYVKTALERLDEYRPLYETLGKYIPEWQ